MNVQVDHFPLSSSAQDRIKIPPMFWAGLKAVGLSHGPVLRLSELPLTVYGGDGFVSTKQLFALWAAIRQLSGNPSIGWKLMSRIETHQYRPALLASLHARDYWEALYRHARYKQLCSAQEFRFTRRNEEVFIEPSWPFAGAAMPPPAMVDSIFALVLELGRRGTNTKLNAKRVELTRQKEVDDGLSVYFGCPVKYRATRDVLVLRTADLELPFVTHNDELLQMLVPQFENQLKDGRAKLTTVGHVRCVLKRLLSGCRPDVLMVAKELGMSERTLQRRITQEGTTFRQMLNETRREMVREYLRDVSVEITEAAFLVGYEDANSFYRAFRSWRARRRLNGAMRI
jgi:AraC-like DNA-binding protein